MLTDTAGLKMMFSVGRPLPLSRYGETAPLGAKRNIVHTSCTNIAVVK